MKIKSIWKWGLIVTLAGLVFSVARCTRDVPEIAEDETDLVYLNHSDTVKYVGIETCKQCHYSIYQSFVETGMGSSFGVADTGKSIAKISGHSSLFDSYHNLNYHPFWDNDSLHVKEFRLSGKDTIYKKKVTIDYVVGSGQHTNSHIYEYQNYLFQAPFTWYAQKGKLDLPPGYENGANSRFDRKIGLECTSCHNAMPTGFVPGSINKYTKVPKAIDCERCHGPGELHVKRMMAGEVVDTSEEIDYSIVNLKKLPVDLQFEACQRCHLQGNSVMAEGKTFFDFKPGMKLNSVMDIYLPRYSNSDDEFIMASHVDRFKQSKCYLNSMESFNCVSCHNPHISVKVTGSTQFNNSCYNCHSGAPKHECTELESKLKARDFNCVACHMPNSSSIDIPHVTVHDHKIKVPGKIKDATGLKEFLGLVAVNNNKPTTRSKAVAYLQQFERFDNKPYMLDSAEYFLKKLGTQVQQKNLWVHYYFLRKDYGAIATLVSKVGQLAFLQSLNKTTYDNADAWTAYRIGESFSNQGNKQSLEFYKKATELAPYIPDFMNKYATALVGAGRVEEGVAVFEQLLKDLPNHKEALNNLGFVYMQQGKLQLAQLFLEKSLAEDPDYEKGWLNMASFHILKENKPMAMKAINEVLRINPRNEKAKSAKAFLLKG